MRLELTGSRLSRFACIFRSANGGRRATPRRARNGRRFGLALLLSSLCLPALVANQRAMAQEPMAPERRAPQRGEVPGAPSAPADPPAPAAPAPEQPAPEQPAPEPEAAPEQEELRAPDAEPPTFEEADLGEVTIPSPADLESLLEEQLPDPAPQPGWTAPVPVLTLHGYFRARGELMDNFWLGRPVSPGPDNLPFSRFAPRERISTPAGGCGGSDVLDGGGCDVSSLAQANMRLRMSPTLRVTDDIRVHATFDAFDNLVAGSTPGSFYVPLGATDPARDAFASTLLAPEERRDLRLRDSIIARRAWAEVRNRDLGELRFGRMPWSWGLGLVAHQGDGFDDDFSTDVDRLMGVTKLGDFYITAAYDFAAEGFVRQGFGRLVDVDGSQFDDVDQYMLSVSRQHTPDERSVRLAAGKSVFNYGLMAMYRRQRFTSVVDPMVDGTLPVGGDGEGLPANEPVQPVEPDLVHLGFEAVTADVWVEFLYDSLRIGFETVLVMGGIDNPGPDKGTNYSLRQFGAALETEYRLLDEKLGLYFFTGLASGDANAGGLSWADDMIPAEGTSSSISTFRFNPNYRVDLILWRHLMRGVTGAYYFKPGVSYDFVRDPDGEQLGGRIDAIWSRATVPAQSWGGAADLGLELNGSLYWRSEAGPEWHDGFQAMLQYAVLFPFAGLGGVGPEGAAISLRAAQTLRLLLGVVY